MSDAQPSLKVERRTTTLRELALEKMRTAILEAHFQPGERLVERSLCEGLGVSRTVVREVLRHLEAEGLVDSIPNQGATPRSELPLLTDRRSRSSNYDSGPCLKAHSTSRRLLPVGRATRASTRHRRFRS